MLLKTALPMELLCGFFSSAPLFLAVEVIILIIKLIIQQIQQEKVRKYTLAITPLSLESFVFGNRSPAGLFVLNFFVLAFFEKSPTIRLAAKYFLACSSQFIQRLL